MFECPSCKKLAEENRYLRTLVDRLLEKVGVVPVDPQPPIGAEHFHSEGEDDMKPQDRVGL